MSEITEQAPPSPRVVPAPAPPRGGLLREAFGAFVVSLVATVTLYRFRTVPFVGENLHSLVGLVFLLIPIWLLPRRGESFERYGIALGGLLGEGATGGLLAFPRDLFHALRRGYRKLFADLGFAVAISAVIFPPFYVGFRIYWGVDAFHFRAPPDFWSTALAQLLVVALPEEFFYRGYLQTRLGQAFTGRVRVLGTPMGWHVVVASVLFGLGHYLVDLNPERLAVFFPALLFGWVRERRGTIGVAVFLHALCNLMADILVLGFLR